MGSRLAWRWKKTFHQSFHSTNQPQDIHLPSQHSEILEKLQHLPSQHSEMLQQHHIIEISALKALRNNTATSQHLPYICPHNTQKYYYINFTTRGGKLTKFLCVATMNKKYLNENLI